MTRIKYLREHEQKVVLTDLEEIKYLSYVLRLKPGSQIELYNEEISSVYAVVVIKKEEIELSLESTKKNFTNDELKITLICSPLKNGNTELIIQKATELGINEIILTNFQRSVVKYSDFAAKKKRFEKIITGALNQSRQVKVPNLDYLNFTDSLLKLESELVICCYELEKKQTLKEWEDKINEQRNITVIIGPEGGISESEIEELKKFNTLFVTLGTSILRAETAVIAALAQVKYIIGG